MKNTFNNMLEHPFATAFIIGAVSNGIANIINVVKGNEIKPMLIVEIGNKSKKESK